MGDKFKLDADGLCRCCSKNVVAGETVQCSKCQNYYHGLCTDASEGEAIANKSFMTVYVRPSTKNNFKFFCDLCSTKMENEMVQNDTIRLNTMEENMRNVTSELQEIKKLFTTHVQTTATNQQMVNTKKDNIWFNEERLTTAVVSQKESLLVEENENNVGFADVEKMIVEKKIPVTNSYKNNKGGLVLEFDNLNTRNQLEESLRNKNIETKKFTKKKRSITIVGFITAMKKEEVINQLVTQNQYVNQFGMANNIEEHVEIYDVKATRSNPQVYQAFAAVSESLRTGLKSHGDKVIIGITNCKVYDRYFVKRCNNCQSFGHYYKECPTPNNPICGKCSLDHSTKDCTTPTRKKCINCTNDGHNDTSHTSFDQNCPSLLKIIEKKKNQNTRALNSNLLRGNHH